MRHRTSSTFASERELDERVERFLSSLSFRVYRQNGFLGAGVVDVTGIAPNGDVWMIEDKLTNWRKVIEQARKHHGITHYAFVCLPEREWPQAMYDAAKAAQVGVMLARQDAVRIVQPAPRLQTVPMLMGHVWRHLAFVDQWNAEHTADSE